MFLKILEISLLVLLIAVLMAAIYAAHSGRLYQAIILIFAAPAISGIALLLLIGLLLLITGFVISHIPLKAINWLLSSYRKFSNKLRSANRIK